MSRHLCLFHQHLLVLIHEKNRRNMTGQFIFPKLVKGFQSLDSQIARTEIPKRLLKTAALIAYHQPMAQNKLVEMVGQVTYEHVSDLRELGLIDKRRDGNTRRLTTTRRFSEYFGCPHTATSDVATWFKEQAKAMGLTGSQLAEALSGDDEDVLEPVEGTSLVEEIVEIEISHASEEE